jgi:hypothetical protein
VSNLVRDTVLLSAGETVGTLLYVANPVLWTGPTAISPSTLTSLHLCLPARRIPHRDTRALSRFAALIKTQDWLGSLKDALSLRTQALFRSKRSMERWATQTDQGQYVMPNS